MDEYYTYDTHSFIADIGGYMVRDYLIIGLRWLATECLYLKGLCLGASILTFYDLALDMTGKTVKYVVKLSSGRLNSSEVVMQWQEFSCSNVHSFKRYSSALL